MNSRRLRILIKFLNIHKSFYWFEYKDKNLYWGSSTKEIQYRSEGNFKNLIINSESGNLLLDNSCNKLIGIKHNKFSYHTSGEAHNREIDTANSKNEPYKAQWTEFEKVDKCELFFAVLSRPVYLLDDYNKNINKGKTHSFTVEVDKAYVKNRTLFEFYITPRNQFKPQFMFIPDEKASEINIFNLNEKLDLVFRCIVLENENFLNNWETGKEFVFINHLKQ